LTFSTATFLRDLTLPNGTTLLTRSTAQSTINGNLTMQSGSGRIGAANSGYWGIALQSGTTYDLNFYARGTSGFSGPVAARLKVRSVSPLFCTSSENSNLASDWPRRTG